MWPLIYSSLLSGERFEELAGPRQAVLQGMDLNAAKLFLARAIGEHEGFEYSALHQPVLIASGHGCLP